MVNEGKKFEKDFKDSIPENVWFYKLRDSASGYQGGEKARFTPSNICDFQLYHNKLFLLELKSTKEKSLSIGDIRKALYEKKDSEGKKIKYNTGVVKTNQVEGMRDAVLTNSNIIAGFVVNFRRTNETFFLHINDFINFIDYNDRKSIPIEYFYEKGFLIHQKIKRVRWRYAIAYFIDMQETIF